METSAGPITDHPVLTRNSELGALSVRSTGERVRRPVTEAWGGSGQSRYPEDERLLNDVDYFPFWPSPRFLTGS